jgi:stage IV sporulation protein FB
MRDPMTWSIPLFRAFGIQVKLHILYIIITLAMLLRVYSQPGGKEHLAEFALIWVVMLFVVILLHEFGHCFAARKVDGEADEILMWPLGGLAYCSVPHTARANFVCTAGGPAVNVVFCVLTAAALSTAGFLPPFNIFQSQQIYEPELYNWQKGQNVKPYSNSGYFETQEENPRRASTMNWVKEKDETYLIPDPSKPGGWVKARMIGEVYPAWVLWTARLFWLNWFLLLLNLIPAFPLDGGRFLQEILWARSGDYRSATQVACWSGLVISLLFLLVSFWWNDSMLLFLGVFIMFTSYQQLMILERGVLDEGTFGYDFSKGYGGMPDEDAPAVKPRRVGPIKRWLQARRNRKLQREVEQRAADERRLDELLDKISRTGKESLTPEERRFMDRVSARYRNRP